MAFWRHERYQTFTIQIIFKYKSNELEIYYALGLVYWHTQLPKIIVRSGLKVDVKMLACISAVQHSCRKNFGRPKPERIAAQNRHNSQQDEPFLKIWKVFNSPRPNRSFRYGICQIQLTLKNHLVSLSLVNILILLISANA